MVIQLGGLSSCSYKTQQTKLRLWNCIKLGLEGIPEAHQVQPSVESRALDLDDPGLCLRD